MVERNLCVESGCRGGCCRYVKLRGVSQNELDRSFPGALEVKEGELGIETLQKGKGVYMAETNYLPDRPYEVQIVGECPNLGSDYYCKLGDERPEPCKSFQMGSEPCDKKRALISVPPVESALKTEARRLDRERNTLDL